MRRPFLLVGAVNCDRPVGPGTPGHRVGAPLGRCLCHAGRY